jgi:hypothetical protein
VQNLDTRGVGPRKLFTRPSALTESRRVKKDNHVAISKAMPEHALKISGRGDAASVQKDVKAKRVELLVKLNGDSLCLCSSVADEEPAVRSQKSKILQQ